MAKEHVIDKLARKLGLGHKVNEFHVYHQGCKNYSEQYPDVTLQDLQQGRAPEEYQTAFNNMNDTAFGLQLGVNSHMRELIKKGELDRTMADLMNEVDKGEVPAPGKAPKVDAEAYEAALEEFGAHNSPHTLKKALLAGGKIPDFEKNIKTAEQRQVNFMRQTERALKEKYSQENAETISNIEEMLKANPKNEGLLLKLSQLKEQARQRQEQAEIEQEMAVVEAQKAGL